MPDKITMNSDGVLSVPDEPIIPFVEGAGTGVDIWPAARLVMDAAAAKHAKAIAWKEVLAGQKAFDATGSCTIHVDVAQPRVVRGAGVDAAGVTIALRKPTWFPRDAKGHQGS